MPATAAASLADLLQFPKQRDLVSQIEKKSGGRGTYDVFIRSQDDHATIKNPDVASNYLAWTASLGRMDMESATSLVCDGIAPILERFAVPPYQIPRAKAWLLNAAQRLALSSNPNFKLSFFEPYISREGGDTFGKVEISGYDIEAAFGARHKTWSFTIDIYDFPVGRNEDIIIANEESITWNRIWKKKQNASDDSFRSTRGWRLAKSVIANFDGYVGYKADARSQIMMFITRCASQGDALQDPFDNMAGIQQQVIRAQIPWIVGRTSTNDLLIKPKDQLHNEVSEKLSEILVSSSDANAIIEVLTAMLIQLVTGGTLRAVFAQGCQVADNTNGMLEDGGRVAPLAACRSPDRGRHWHVCTACLDGFPCTLIATRHIGHFSCLSCTAKKMPTDGAARAARLPHFEARSGEEAHSRGQTRSHDPNRTVYKTQPRNTPRRPDFRRDLADLGSSQRPLQRPHQQSIKPRTSMHIPGILEDRVRQWLSADYKEAGLAWGGKESDAELSTIMGDINRLYRVPGSTKDYHDLYIKGQKLSEDVERSLDWTGRYQSPFAPSVEGILRPFFRNNKTRYHTEKNIGTTSVSVNTILGSSPKILGRGIKLYLTALSHEDYEQADIIAQRAMIINAELSLNTLYKRAGAPETQYLRNIQQNCINGTLPEVRYVPADRLLYAMSRSPPTTEEGWIPPEYEYLQPQIELVAARYGFSEEGRDLWTLQDDTLTDGREVPFIFSKRSPVFRWTWRDCYLWFCERLKRLKTECDNHSIQAYEDNPLSRLHLNIERFILALLHIFLSKLEDDKRKSGQYDGQPFRALDDAGLESFCNVRTPFSQSVAHITHGAVMLVGYVNLEDERPTSQGPAVFDLENRNVTLETWVANGGRYTHDLGRMSDIMRQFHNFRDTAEDLILDAPRSYPTGTLHYDPAQHQRDLRPRVAAPDANFRFSGHRAIRRTQEDSDADEADENDEDPDNPQNESEVQAGAGQHSSAASHQLAKADASLTDRGIFPLRSNLDRGKSTCYVSTILQFFHNIQPLATILKSTKVSQNIIDAAVLRLDEGLQLHTELLQTLHNVMIKLDTFGDAREQVSSDNVQDFRRACQELDVKIGLANNNVEWRWADVDQDASEFFQFVLERLSVLSDQSSIGYSGAPDTPWKMLEAKREMAYKSKALPKMDQDIDDFQQAYRQSGYDSETSRAYTIHTIREEKCDSEACGKICRSHEFSPKVMMKTMQASTSEGDSIDFDRLKQAYLHDTLLKKPGQRTSCPVCVTGSLVEVRQRIANEPEILLMHFDRASYDRRLKRSVADPRRLSGYDEEISLADWTPSVFSDAETHEPSQARYRLVGVLFHLASPPHYVAYIRLGQQEVVSRDPRPAFRYGRKNDGKWVQFDDLQREPQFSEPFSEMRAVSLLLRRILNMLTPSGIHRDFAYLPPHRRG